MNVQSKPAGPEQALSPDALAVELRIAVMRTSRRLRTEASGDIIPAGQYTVLAHLTGGPRTLRELADREQVQAPSMTRIVNGLAEQGLVARQTHPEDGRQVLVRITEAGEAVLAEARSHRTAWLAQRLAELGEDDRRILGRAAHLMQEMSAR
ncbi:MarR family winged helix-turn-helix transcriptional regulator [Arthrobacter mobilis]|uniref:MarR family transcriptional regulator n=1 Tax=Arthrobacter mobilis TaxID=2724944 RepID=A0A7X6K4T2_9MICC|nr:MarR family transcriptional regulator [Arthrobacter mobilis]NKX53060.1 MarR family transcriptional regulator [Arthrobacter mobilis]